jgi:transposase
MTLLMALRVLVWELASQIAFLRLRPFSNQSVLLWKTAMTSRKGKRFRPVPKGVDPLQVVHRHAAGVDAHAKEHFVCVPADAVPADFVNPDPQLPPFVRCFGTNTGDLEAVADWLRQCGVTTVAVESTGIYHLALVEMLEKHGIEVVIVDPRQTAHSPGRPKSDVLDCQWIQRLHSYGLLRASFRPGPEIRKLRSYERQREMLLRYAASHVQHMQKALEQMNCKLPEVVTDITGVTGMLIIKAIVRGVRDPQRLAGYRHGTCKATEAEIAAALQGNWQEEYLFDLNQALKLYEEYQRRLRDCEAQIEACLRKFPVRSEGTELPANPRPRSRSKNAVHFDARELLFRITGVDVTVLEGIDQTTALVLLSELGFDLSKFPTERHFTSWLRLSPNHRGSANKIKSRRTGHASSRASRAFRLAAQGCHHAKNAMGAFYRRIAARASGAKAVVATARKIAERFYRLMTKGGDYVRQEMNFYEKTYQLRLTRGLAKRAADLGYRLVPVALAE